MLLEFQKFEWKLDIFSGVKCSLFSSCAKNRPSLETSGLASLIYILPKDVLKQVVLKFAAFNGSAQKFKFFKCFVFQRKRTKLSVSVWTSYWYQIRLSKCLLKRNDAWSIQLHMYILIFQLLYLEFSATFWLSSPY